METPYPSGTALNASPPKGVHLLLEEKGNSFPSNYQNIFFGIYHSYFCIFYFLTYKTGPEREETRSFPAEFSVLSNTGPYS